MKNDTSGTFWRSAMVIIASVFALMMASGNAALAGGNDPFKGKGKKIFVSGNSTFSDCGVSRSDFALLLTGKLKGCLSVFVKNSKCKKLEGFDLYKERGREVFKGKLHGEWGEFETRYTFEAAFAPGYCESLKTDTPLVHLEVGGGCIHEVWGRSGVFKRAEGVITFIDVITGVTGDPISGSYEPGFGGNNFLYSGHLRRKYTID